MSEVFALEPVAVDADVRCVPDDLPVESPERDKLDEEALRASGLAILLVDPAAAADELSQLGERRRLRAAVTALVELADSAERERLESAATADAVDDGLDERSWGPAPDSEANA
jgi:hypothetical protein